jgi:hypothetical protein
MSHRKVRTARQTHPNDLLDVPRDLAIPRAPGIAQKIAV